MTSDLGFVRIKEGWWQAGRVGMSVAPATFVDGQYWTGIIWSEGDECDGPEWYKTASLEAITPPKKTQKQLLARSKP